MADESLKWIIEKITYCDNKTQVSGFDGGPTDEFWVKVTNTGGTGEAQTQIEIKPSQLHNACQTAVISISASTDEKKYVTVERCNPECNCDAITGFTAITTAEASADGQTGITVANFAMDYGCDPSDVSLVGGGATYRTVGNNILADVGPNDTYEEKTYTYYVTYGGEKCYNITGNTLYFKQEAKENPCADAECPTVNVPGTSVDIGYDGGNKRFTITDGYENCWILSDTYDKNNNTGWSIDWVNKYTDGIIQFDKNRSEEEKHFEFVFNFAGINDNTTFTCSTEATQEISITQKGTPHVEVCTCDNSGLRNVTGDTIPASYTSQRPFGYFTADCEPEDGFPISHVNREGSSNIVNFNKDVGYSKQGSSSSLNYLMYGYINNNPNGEERREWIEICGEEFEITQKGTGTPTPTTCEVHFEEPYASIECVNEDGRNIQVLRVYASKTNCKDNQNVSVNYTVFKKNGEETDEYDAGTMVLLGSSDSYTTPIKHLTLGDYIVQLSRIQNVTEAKEVTTNVITIDENNRCSETVTLRFEINVNKNVFTPVCSECNDDLWQVHSFVAFLAKKGQGDDENTEKIFFPLKKDGWKGTYWAVDGSHPAGTDYPVTTYSICTDVEGYFYPYYPELYNIMLTYGELYNPSSRIYKIYQDVTVDINEFHLSSQEDLNQYTLYLAEVRYTNGSCSDITTLIQRFNPHVAGNWESIQCMVWDVQGWSELYIGGNSSRAYRHQNTFTYDHAEIERRHAGGGQIDPDVERFYKNKISYEVSGNYIDVDLLLENKTIQINLLGDKNNSCT